MSNDGVMMSNDGFSDHYVLVTKISITTIFTIYCISFQNLMMCIY